MSPHQVVTALPVVDELVTDEGSVVLIAGSGGASRILRLSAIGAAVRELTRDGMSLGDLADRLTERFGAPEGSAVGIVADLVETLVAQGTVSVGSVDLR